MCSFVHRKDWYVLIFWDSSVHKIWCQLLIHSSTLLFALRGMDPLVMFYSLVITTVHKHSLPGINWATIQNCRVQAKSLCVRPLGSKISIVLFLSKTQFLSLCHQIVFGTRSWCSFAGAHQKMMQLTPGSLVPSSYWTERRFLHVSNYCILKPSLERDADSI